MAASKRLYEAVAGEILDMSIGGEPTRFEMADRLADCFAEDNPRFDRLRFLDACGFPSPLYTGP